MPFVKIPEPKILAGYAGNNSKLGFMLVAETTS
jgi:hypothetical protein